MADSRDDQEFYWVKPKVRGVLSFDEFHIPRKLNKLLKTAPFEVTYDQAFGQVIESCAAFDKNRQDTWINQAIMDVYLELHQLGFAHSVECWQDGILVGGLYGLSMASVFFGESMFSRQSGASKIAFIYLIHRLLKGGYTLLDTQFYSEHLAQFGACEMAHDDFEYLLNKALSYEAFWKYETDQTVAAGLDESSSLVVPSSTAVSTFFASLMAS
jgi:leucyl/phenylalanyl-tRNA---protein transferase